MLIQVLHNFSPLSKCPPLSSNFALVSSKSESWHQSCICDTNDFSTSSSTLVHTFRSSSAELHLEKVVKALIASGSAVFFIYKTISTAFSWTSGGSDLNPKTRNAEAHK